MIEKTAEYLRQIIIDYSKNGLLLLVSGGSCLEVINKLEDCWSDKVTIGVIDERYSANPNINNLSQIKNLSFWQFVKKARCPVVNSEIKKGETMGAMAARMEKQWKNWRKHNKFGKIIVLLGMGTDGHTAGIMPMVENKEKFNELFVENKAWVCGYDAGEKNIYRYRLTATMSFLINEVFEVVVFSQGEEKLKTWQEVKNPSKKMWELPIKVIEKMKKVTKFVS